MTPRELRGDMPALVTYDADGNVLSVTVSEPRISRAEVEALLASRRLERQPRGDHGHLIADATDPSKKWVVPKPKRDYAGEKLVKAKGEYRKLYPDADHSTLLWSVMEEED